MQGDVGAARSYQLGQWDSPDLGLLLQWALANEDAVGPLIHGNFLGRLLARLSYLFQPNSLSGSKRNIQAHYDIGNDFYQLFLDSSMSYSSALYTGSEASELDLYQAQQRKYQRALEQLDASSGKLLEIGCGWGGFAETASTQGDYQVKGITLSEAQRAYAQQRLQANDNVAISLEDYRQQSGSYQNIVSIENAGGHRRAPMAAVFPPAGHAAAKAGARAGTDYHHRRFDIPALPGQRRRDAQLRLPRRAAAAPRRNQAMCASRRAQDLGLLQLRLRLRQNAELLASQPRAQRRRDQRRRLPGQPAAALAFLLELLRRRLREWTH